MKKQISKASADLVTLAEIKAHCGIDHALNDSLLTIYSTAATAMMERELDSDLQETVWEESFAYFTTKFYLTANPISSIEKLEYYNSANELTEIATENYITYLPQSARGEVKLIDDVEIPTVYNRTDAVIVTYTTGYTTIPPLIKAAILLQIGSFYEHRENETELNLKTLAIGVQRIIDIYREYKY